MALMEYMIIYDEGKKIKERMRNVMDDGVCQNQRLLSVSVVNSQLCSLKSLYIGFNWTLGFIFRLLNSFIFI